MACITLTRTTLPGAFGTLPASCWEVAYEGLLVATYAEGVDGWLRQIGSSRLDAWLSGHAAIWGPTRKYPSLDDLREAYLLDAKAWEKRDAGESLPRIGQ